MTDMIDIEVNGQQFQRLTCSTAAGRFIQSIKDDCIDSAGNDDGLYQDNSLYIEYRDGSSISVFEGDPVAKIRKTGITMLILDADWGTCFYHGYPEMDETYPDDPMIRIAAEPGEYGKAIKL